MWTVTLLLVVSVKKYYVCTASATSRLYKLPGSASAAYCMEDMSDVDTNGDNLSRYIDPLNADRVSLFLYRIMAVLVATLQG